MYVEYEADDEEGSEYDDTVLESMTSACGLRPSADTAQPGLHGQGLGKDLGGMRIAPLKTNDDGEFSRQWYICPPQSFVCRTYYNMDRTMVLQLLITVGHFHTRIGQSSNISN